MVVNTIVSCRGEGSDKKRGLAWPGVVSITTTGHFKSTSNCPTNDHVFTSNEFILQTNSCRKDFLRANLR